MQGKSPSVDVTYAELAGRGGGACRPTADHPVPGRSQTQPFGQGHARPGPQLKLATTYMRVRRYGRPRRIYVQVQQPRIDTATSFV
jgi:hypothetical protein